MTLRAANEKVLANCKESCYVLGDGYCNGGDYNNEECECDGGDCDGFNKYDSDCTVFTNMYHKLDMDIVIEVIATPKSVDGMMMTVIVRTNGFTERRNGIIYY